MSPRLLIITVASVAALLLSACSSEPAAVTAPSEPGVALAQTEPAAAVPAQSEEGTAATAESEPVDTETVPTVEPTDEQTPSTSGSEEDAASEGGDASEAPEIDPIATGEFEVTDLQENVVPLRFDVEKLERDGNVTRLDFRVTNLSDDVTWTINDRLGAGYGNYDASGVSLIDLGNDLRYLVLQGGECLCSGTSSVDVPPDAGLGLSATYPELPADVSALDIQFDELGTIPSVPVSG